MEPIEPNLWFEFVDEGRSIYISSVFGFSSVSVSFSSAALVVVVDEPVAPTLFCQRFQECSFGGGGGDDDDVATSLA